jgi:hypothetical protein
LLALASVLRVLSRYVVNPPTTVHSCITVFNLSGD